jgi:phosphopantothenoylcysteine decarboxylase / phosphopantothenate---cysteine ligase
MWSNVAVQENRQKLADRGVRILGPAVGDQACGESGPGRMLEPGEIVAAVTAPVAVPDTQTPALRGKVVLITAGPTREAIDPVRYVSNRSSGKMGFALAAAAQDAGARVILISGPVSIAAPVGVQRIDVESARDMFAATHEHIGDTDIFIAAAAVADYRPVDVKNSKIKKSDEDMSIELVRSPDILASVARLEKGPFTVGFAAETDNLRGYAIGKLEKKKLDMIVANLVGNCRGFDTDENAVDVFWCGGERTFPLADKGKLAHDLVALIAQRYLQEHGASAQEQVPAAAAGD